MKGRAAAEGEPGCELGAGEEFDEGAADHEVLLDVVIEGPGARDRHSVGDHRSGSTSVLRMRRQRWFRGASGRIEETLTYDKKFGS